jgi:hypothetical protein
LTDFTPPTPERATERPEGGVPQSGGYPLSVCANVQNKGAEATSLDVDACQSPCTRDSVTKSLEV